MINVLVLDDSVERHNWFGQNLKLPVPHGVSHVYTVPQAIQFLEARTYHTIYLDHDLGTEPAVGRDVARWLIEHPEQSPDASIIVHSVNVVSGPKIERELRE